MRNQSANTPKEEYISAPEFYSQVIDSLQDYAVITTDRDLIINSWSVGATNIFGYEPMEAISQHIKLIFVDEDKENNIPVSESRRALADGRATDNRWHVRKDGSRFYSFGLVFPLMGSDNNFKGFVKILRDLTENMKWENAIKKYVKELEELNNHKENILAILSHDLRSPLSAIITKIQLLKMQYHNLSDDEVMNMIDSIAKKVNDELNIMDYLLEWARIKYASEVFTPKKVQLKNAVDRVSDVLNEEAGVHNIKLQNMVPEDVNVYADEKMLNSILQNIISNAIRHSKKEGLVEITSEIKENKVITCIRDQGAGISWEVRERIFTPQLNLLSSAREENKGGGIGLLLVKGFVEKNNGEIWAESIEGEGASFWFTLPLNKPD